MDSEPVTAPDTSLTTVNIKDSDEGEPCDSPYDAIVWTFLYRFSPALDDPLWPGTIDEFEAALLETTERHPDIYQDEVYKPTLEPILRWFESSLKRSHGGTWATWLTSWVNERMKTRGQQECRLAEHWEGVNRLHQAGSFWQLHWKDKLLLLKLLTDHMLAYSNPVREVINVNYQVSATRETNRHPRENPLICERVGSDRNRNSYWQLDDSPRLWSSGNPFKLHCPLFAKAFNEPQLRDFVKSLLPPEEKDALAPMFKKKKSGEAEERKLRQYIEKQMLPKVAAYDSRQQELFETRQKIRREAIEAKEREAAEQQEGSRGAKPSSPRVARLRTTKKEVDYQAGESDKQFNVVLRELQGDAEAAAKILDSSPDPGPRKRKRPRGDDDFLDLDTLEAEQRERPTRRADTGTERRSSRTAAKEAPIDYYNNSTGTGQRETTPVDEPVHWARKSRRTESSPVRLPRGAKAADYDLKSLPDVVAWRGNTPLIIKGSLTAQAEIAQDLAADAQHRVKLLEAGREAPLDKLPAMPRGADPNDYEMNSISDTKVYGRGAERSVKGVLTAAREVAAELETDAAKAVEVATTSGCAPGHPPSIAASRPRLDVFGRPITYDAAEDEASSTMSGPPANGKLNGSDEHNE